MVARTRSRSSLGGSNIPNGNNTTMRSSNRNRRTTLGPISTNRPVSLADDYVDGDVIKKRTVANNSVRKQKRMSMIPRIASSSSSSSTSNSNMTSNASSNTTKSKSTRGRKSLSLTPAKVSSTKSRKSIAQIPSSTSTSPYTSSSLSSSSRRQSSIPPPSTMRVDNRPISDKAYFNTCVKSLYSYLTNNGYQQPMKLKDLKSPSGKDFHSIMIFLLGKIDESFYHNHVRTPGSSSSSTSNNRDNNKEKRKFEDDVANTFRTLGYPFNISKTALVAAGSPHTWPSLLLAITWLIELLNSMSDEYLYEDDLIMDDNENNLFGNDEISGEEIHGESTSMFSRLDEHIGNGSLGDNNMNTNSAGNKITSLGDTNTIMDDLATVEQKMKVAMNVYVERSYKVFFFDGDDDTYEKMEHDLLEYMEKNLMMIEQAVERINDENGLILEQISNVEQEVVDLPEHEKRLEQLAEELEHFHELVEKMKEHKDIQYAKVQERNAELEVKKQDMAKIESRIQGLVETIANQEYTKEDVYQLERNRAKIEESVAQLLRKREEYESLTVKGEIDLKRELERLERFVGPYNRCIEELPLDENGDNYYKDIVVEGNDEDIDAVVAINITIEKEMADQKEQKCLLGQVDLKNEVVPLLRKMEQKYMEGTTHLRTNSYELLDRQTKADEDLVELKDRERCLNESMKRAKEMYQQEKQEHEETLLIRQREVENLEKKVETLRDPSAVETVMSKYQSQINDLSTLREKHQKGNLARRQAVLDELNRALSIVSEYKQYRENEIRKSRKYLESQQHFITIKPLSDEQEKILSS